MNIPAPIGSLMRHLRYSGRLDPVRDWVALLTFSTVVLAGIVAWNVWAFDTVVRGGVIGAPASLAPPVFSRSSLDAIHTIFAGRAAEETKYETGVYTFTDPSQ